MACPTISSGSPLKPVFVHADERRVICSRSKEPFHDCGSPISRPFNSYSPISLNRFYTNLYGNLIHLPVPLDLFARFQRSATFGKPELGCDSRIDKGLKNLSSRPAN